MTASRFISGAEMSDPVTAAIAATWVCRRCEAINAQADNTCAGCGTTKSRRGLPTLAEMFERNAQAVRGFPALPDDAWSPIEIIGCLEHCTVQTLWRRSKNGTGPRIVTIGGQARVNVGEYRRLNAARLAAAAQPEAVAA